MTIFTGTNGDDEAIAGPGGSSTLVGFAPALPLDLEDGVGDTFNCGDGADLVSAGNSDDYIVGGIGDDTLKGGLGKDTLVGGANNDLLIVGVSEEIIAGEMYHGGSGFDTLGVSTVSNLYNAFDFRSTVIVSIEQLQYFTGSAQHDVTISATQIGAGFSTALSIVTNDGGFPEQQRFIVSMDAATSLTLRNFQFSGWDVGDKVLVYGDDDAETIVGSSQRDSISGFGGNDTLWGSYFSDAQSDALAGGDGNDTYFVYESFDVVTEDNANSLIGGVDIVYSAANYKLPANVENLTLFGSNVALTQVQGNSGNTALNAMQYTGGSGITFTDDLGDDVVYGSSYADTITTGRGNDTLWGSWGADGRADAMSGGDGNDTYFVQESLDSVSETNSGVAGGIDTVYSAINMALGSNPEYLFIYGSATVAIGNGLGNAVVGSYSGLELLLRGMGGTDTITGGGGNDLIDGGGGVDSLTGSGGADTFVFRPGETNGDVIHDFNGAGAGALDTLRFENYGAGATFTQIDATHWQINWFNNMLHDVITFSNAAAIHPTDYVFV